jgi:hypothetical protein
MKQPRHLACLASFAVLLVTNLAAQELRDPTRPPAQAQTTGGEASEALLGTEGLSVVQRDGKPFLVVGTRLVAPGQKIGAFKLERISETEIWLLDGKELRKIARFTGIQRKPSAQP